MEVTATAVRQRLVRLLAKTPIQREATRHGRGRPETPLLADREGGGPDGLELHRLAVTLWQEIRASRGPETASETLPRSPGPWQPAMPTDPGRDRPERMRSLAELLDPAANPRLGGAAQRRADPDGPCLPLPQVGRAGPEHLRMERMMFSELLGENVGADPVPPRGGTECRFQPVRRRYTREPLKGWSGTAMGLGHWHLRHLASGSARRSDNDSNRGSKDDLTKAIVTTT